MSEAHHGQGGEGTQETPDSGKRPQALNIDKLSDEDGALESELDCDEELVFSSKRRVSHVRRPKEKTPIRLQKLVRLVSSSSRLAISPAASSTPGILDFSNRRNPFSPRAARAPTTGPIPVSASAGPRLQGIQSSNSYKTSEYIKSQTIAVPHTMHAGVSETYASDRNPFYGDSETDEGDSLGNVNAKTSTYSATKADDRHSSKVEETESTLRVDDIRDGRESEAACETSPVSDGAQQIVDRSKAKRPLGRRLQKLRQKLGMKK